MDWRFSYSIFFFKGYLEQWYLFGHLCLISELFSSISIWNWQPFSLQSPNCLHYFDFLVLILFGSIFLVLHIFLIWTGKNVEMHRPLWFGFILNRILVLSIWCWLMKFEKWWNWSFHCILRQSWWTKTDNVHRCTACDHFIYIAKLSCTHADRWVQEVTLIKMGEKKTGW